MESGRLRGLSNTQVTVPRKAEVRSEQSKVEWPAEKGLQAMGPLERMDRASLTAMQQNGWISDGLRGTHGKAVLVDLSGEKRASLCGLGKEESRPNSRVSIASAGGEFLGGFIWNPGKCRPKVCLNRGWHSADGPEGVGQVPSPSPRVRPQRADQSAWWPFHRISSTICEVLEFP